MTVVEISKQKIINAIRKERLQGGTWIDKDINYKYLPIEDYKNCAVCAVGAVMKNILNPTLQLSWIDRVCSFIIDNVECGDCLPTRESRSIKDAVQQVKDEKYMSGLSLFFELECDNALGRSDGYSYDCLSRHQIYRIRRKTIQFVKDHFPSKIQIDIDGAKPAKDVKVIK